MIIIKFSLLNVYIYFSFVWILFLLLLYIYRTIEGGHSFEQSFIDDIANLPELEEM